MEQTKKLYRSIEDRYIGGVCGGLAKYFNMDVVIIRLLFFLALVLGGGGFLAYVVLWIVVPEEPLNRYNMNQEKKTEDEYTVEDVDVEDMGQEDTENKNKSNSGKGKGNLIGGLILVTIGGLFLLDNFIPHLSFGDLWPVLLIIAGIAVLFESFKKRSKNDES